jgi:hypothetical protein
MIQRRETCLIIYVATFLMLSIERKCRQASIPIMTSVELHESQAPIAVKNLANMVPLRCYECQWLGAF